MTGRAFPPLAGIGIGLALVVGSFTAIYLSTRNDLLAQYMSAPACAGLADAEAGGDCRYIATATVTGIGADTNGQSVDFEFPGTYSRYFEATLPRDSAASSLGVGDKVQVEVWRYKVTRLAGANTLDHPGNNRGPGNLLAIGLMLLPIGIGATAWGLIAARRLSRGENEAGGLRMGPVAISDALWH